jgi:hypothetical protein
MNDSVIITRRRTVPELAYGLPISYHGLHPARRSTGKSSRLIAEAWPKRGQSGHIETILGHPH